MPKKLLILLSLEALSPKTLSLLLLTRYCGNCDWLSMVTGTDVRDLIESAGRQLNLFFLWLLLQYFFLLFLLLAFLFVRFRRFRRFLWLIGVLLALLLFLFLIWVYLFVLLFLLFFFYHLTNFVTQFHYVF